MPEPLDVKGASASYLTAYLMAGMEVLFSFSAPGFIALWFAHKLQILIPQELSGAIQSHSKMEIAVVIFCATVLGLLFSQVGDLLLVGLDRYFKVVEKAETEFFEQYSATSLGGLDFSKLNPSEMFSPAQIQEIMALPEEEKTKKFQEIYNRFKAGLSATARRHLNLGISMGPLLAGPIAAEHRREIRAYLSVPDTLFSFFRTTLPVIIFIGGAYASRIGEWSLERASVILATLVVAIFWTNSTFVAFRNLRTSQLSFWIGVGQMADQNAGSPPKKIGGV